MSWGRQLLKSLKQAWIDFSEDDCFTQAAALAYYAIFSIPPLILIVVFIAGSIWEEREAQQNLSHELGQLMGESGAEFVLKLIQRPESDGENMWATALSTLVLLAGSTGVMLQLQMALNRVWNVEANPGQAQIGSLIIKRVLSFAMIIVVATILVLSLLATAILAAMVTHFDKLLPGEAMSGIQYLGNLAATYFFVMLSLAALFRWLPDRTVRWRDVWFGANMTTVLFIVGKELLGWYLGSSDLSGYGGAGALVLLLTWIYYTSLIILFGAELTHVVSEEKQGQSASAAARQGS